MNVLEAARACAAIGFEKPCGATSYWSDVGLLREEEGLLFFAHARGMAFHCPKSERSFVRRIAIKPGLNLEVGSGVARFVTVRRVFVQGDNFEPDGNLRVKTDVAKETEKKHAERRVILNLQGDFEGPER